MTIDIGREEEDRQLKRHKRRLTYCNKCGGTHDHETPHPLGLPLVVLQCSSCGSEKVLVKTKDYYKKPGGGRKKFPF